MARKHGQGTVASPGRIREGVSGRFARPIEELGSSSLDVQRGLLAIPLRETQRNLESGVRTGSKPVAHHARCCRPENAGRWVIDRVLGIRGLSTPYRCSGGGSFPERQIAWRCTGARLLLSDSSVGNIPWQHPGQSRYCIAGLHGILALFDEMFSVALWRRFVGVRRWAVPLPPPLRDHFSSFDCGAEPPSFRMTSGTCIARKVKAIHELLLPCTLRSVPPWQMPQLSKKPASSSLRYWRVSSTLKCTPRPGVSHTSMNPSLTIGEGRPSRTSYHQEGSPVEYSNAM